MINESPYAAALVADLALAGAGRLALAEEVFALAAAVSLRAVTDNPVFIPPEDGRPLGAVRSTGATTTHGRRRQWTASGWLGV